MLSLTRFAHNPVLAPTENWWENLYVYNPGAAVYQDKIILLYRAQGRDRISRFGLAVSSDGINFQRFSDPVIDADEGSKFERLGIEDPRITQIGDTYYIFYTAASVYPASEARAILATRPEFSKVPWRIRTSLITTKDFQSFTRHGVVLPDLDTKDSVLFPERINGKYYLWHRVYPNLHLAESSDLISWKDLGPVLGPSAGVWDGERVGAGSVPLKTPKGWLNFYHGVSKDKIYSLGIFLTDINDPKKILYRSSEPVLTPQTPEEKFGQVNNVVFTCDAIEKNGYYLIYYGEGDKSIGLAWIKKDEILNSVNV